jgi:hypothetical protein
MPDEIPVPLQRARVILPCGPDCRHYQPLATTQEWGWCVNSQGSLGARVTTLGVECSGFTPAGDSSMELAETELRRNAV